MDQTVFFCSNICPTDWDRIAAVSRFKHSAVPRRASKVLTCNEPDVCAGQEEVDHGFHRWALAGGIECGGGKATGRGAECLGEEEDWQCDDDDDDYFEGRDDDAEVTCCLIITQTDRVLPG